MNTFLGWCDKCRIEFNFSAIHNGFNETTYAYCDTCGKTCFLEEYFKEIPEKCKWFFDTAQRYEKISERLEPYLEKCSCGGNFRRNAVPRCPQCRQKLDPLEVNKHVKSDEKYKWQNDWTGIYAMIIKDNKVYNNWKSLGNK